MTKVEVSKQQNKLLASLYGIVQFKNYVYKKVILALIHLLLKTQNKSNLVKYAIEEFKYIKLNTDQDKYMAFICTCLLDLLKLFSFQGHSGLSANITISLLQKLLRFEPLSKIENAEDQWIEITNNLFQHKRISSVFKDTTKNKAYYAEGLVWKEPNGSCFFGTIEGFSSYQPITFPFEPKSFIIEITEDRKIKDRNKLQEALNYFNTK